MQSRISRKTFSIIAIVFLLGLATLAHAAEISNVKISSITNGSAQVDWTTDINTDATINYGLDPAVGTVRDPTFTTKNHTLIIPSLDPATVYHFRVISTDLAGTKSATAGCVFTTKGSQADKAIADIKKITDPAALVQVVDTIQQVAKDVILPPSIIGEPKVIVSENRATITWSTDRDAGSEVDLAPESQYSASSKDSYSITQGDSRESTKKHSVDVIGLDPSTTYHFRVSSHDSLGLTGFSEDATFTTKSLLPTISSTRITKVQETSATIAWSTGSVKAKGVVSYTNLRTKATRSAGSPVFATAQKVVLTGLVFGTRYSAVITATNEGGDNVDGKPFTFVTVRDVVPPVITKVNNESTLFPDADAKVQTIVTWLTDEPSYCQVFYTQGLVKKEGSDGDSLPPEMNPVTSHTSVIVGFAPGSVYKFWMKCHDETGNQSQSDDFVLITPIKEQSIIDVILANFQGTFGWVGNIGKK